jgi:hypothetical protein
MDVELWTQSFFRIFKVRLYLPDLIMKIVLSILKRFRIIASLHASLGADLDPIVKIRIQQDPDQQPLIVVAL